MEWNARTVTFVQGVVIGRVVLVIIVIASAIVIADIGVFVLFAFIQSLYTRDSRSLIAFKD